MLGVIIALMLLGFLGKKCVVFFGVGVLQFPSDEGGPLTKFQLRVARFGSLVKNFTIVWLSAFCV